MKNMFARISSVLSAVVFPLLLIGCSSSTKTIYKQGDVRLYEVPKDWKEYDVREKTINKYSQYLNGKKIFLDPGHGGKDKRNKSASGKVVEADINLRVALALRNYLKEAGAIVLMSREDDITIGLKERPQMSNDSGAELFISIHHNASPSYENNWSNYTSTFYHSKPGEAGYVPAAHNLAKFVQRDLAYVMRNSGGLGSFDGTYSDYKIYPGEGFAVLRESQIPSILVECSFYNAYNEEQRLQIQEFNEIQAWGIFKGIGKYYLNGVPEIKFLKDESLLKKRNLSLVFQIESDKKIVEDDIKVFFGDHLIAHNYEINNKRIFVFVEDVATGSNTVSVECKNINGNYSHPFEKKILIK